MALLFAVVAAAAQQPQLIRGVLDKVDGAMLSIKQANGTDVAVKLLPKAAVFGVEPATLADIKKGDFIGVGAMPQPDGSQKAILVTIFAETQRGLGEGFHPWDRPGSTMTNGTADTVEGVNDKVVMVKYKGGEQKIIIGPDTKIRRYTVGSVDMLKPGAHVAVYRPEKGADGTLQTVRVNVGLNGLEP
jgi:hypothetical protein